MQGGRLAGVLAPTLTPRSACFEHQLRQHQVLAAAGGHREQLAATGETLVELVTHHDVVGPRQLRVELRASPTLGLGNGQVGAGARLQHLQRRHVERLSGGDHARHQDVAAIRHLLERGALPQHAEAAVRCHQRRLQRPDHERDVDDLAVIRDHGDVLALDGEQVVQRREQMVERRVGERRSEHPVEVGIRGAGVQLERLDVGGFGLDHHARRVVEGQRRGVGQLLEHRGVRGSHQAGEHPVVALRIGRCQQIPGRLDRRPGAAPRHRRDPGSRSGIVVLRGTVRALAADQLQRRRLGGATDAIPWSAHRRLLIGARSGQLIVISDLLGVSTVTRPPRRA